MIDLHEVDLAKDLSRLSRHLARAAADIVTELDSPERTTELADYLEDAVRQLRTRARAALPKVIEPHHGQETTVTEQDHSGPRMARVMDGVKLEGEDFQLDPGRSPQSPADAGVADLPRLPHRTGKARFVKEVSTTGADPQLTEQDRVIAALVENIEQQLPGGYQVHMDIRLDEVIKTVDKMFTARKLPLREQLIAELTLWQCHTKDGIRLMERSYQLLHNVIRMIDTTRDPNR